MRKRIGESTSVDFESMVGKRVKFFGNSMVTNPGWEGDVTYTSWTGNELLVSAKNCVTYNAGGTVRENSRKIRKSSPMGRHISYEIEIEVEVDLKLTTEQIEVRQIRVGDEISAFHGTQIRGIVTSIENEAGGNRTVQFQAGYTTPGGNTTAWVEGGRFRYNLPADTPITLYTAPQRSKKTVDRDAMLRAYFKQKVAEPKYGAYNLEDSHPLFQAFVDTFKELTE